MVDALILLTINLNKMKKIKYLLFSVLFVSMFSCDEEPENIVTGDAEIGGVSVEVRHTSLGKALGAPVDGTDLPNSSVNFTDVVLDLEIFKRWAGEDIVKYELLKDLNDGATSVVAESTDLPVELHYTSIAEYIAGTEVSDPDDLRIGDVFTFRTRITKNDGSVYTIHDGGDDTGTYKVTISCSSDLAYEYEVITSGYYGTVNQGIELLVEKSPGLYKTATTGGWGAGSIAPDTGFDFVDVCGSLTVPPQNLAQGFYSNDVYQTDDQAAASFANGATGDLHIEYTISFASGEEAISTNYIRQ